MDLSKEDRVTLGKMAERRRRQRYGTKRAAYSAAGLNAATWDRLEAGEVVREDRLLSAVEALWPEADRDPQKVLSPSEFTGTTWSVKEGSASAILADLNVVMRQVHLLTERVDELEDRLSDHGPSLRRVADEDPDLVAEMEAQQEGP